jgi:hypothetical protein
MTHLLVYWRDYRRNRSASTGDDGVRCWHSSSGLMGNLAAGDRLWMVCSGQTIGREPRGHGHLVEVWTVTGVLANPGDAADYPRERYRHRVLARLDATAAIEEPIDVDAIVRPQQSPRDAMIGRLLQGPRRLSNAAAEQLLAAIGPSAPRIEYVQEQRAANPVELDRELPALGIRQPWAELILRGRKTIEVRSLETNIRGPIYLYTSSRLAEIPAAQRAMQLHGLDAESFTYARIIGSVEITGCRPCTRLDAERACVPNKLLAGKYAWELANPQRLPSPVKPRFLPYGVWFYPFRRRNGE